MRKSLSFGIYALIRLNVTFSKILFWTTFEWSSEATIRLILQEIFNVLGFCISSEIYPISWIPDIYSKISSDVTSSPSRLTTYALGSSLASSSGMPMTAASTIEGCSNKKLSSSAGDTCAKILSTHNNFRIIFNHLVYPANALPVRLQLW